jgi:tetratricopeptide (TPR) repeat protein
MVCNMSLKTPSAARPSVAPRSPYRRLFYGVVVVLLAAVTAWYGACWIIWTRSFESAARAIRLRQYDLAQQHLDWCRWAWPGDPHTWLVSARVARRAGERKQSQEWLDRAEQAGAREREVRLERLLDYGQWEFSPDVEERLREQLKTNRSDYPLIAEVLTGEFMRLYRLPEAREVLDRWVELDPEDTEPFVRRGWVAEHQLDFDAALADYGRVVAMDPQRLPIRMQIAEILFKLRKPAEAIPELKIVQQQQPEDPAVAVSLSRCYRELGEYDEALAALKSLPEAQRETAKVKAELGQIALVQEEFAQAETLLRAALADMPREREALYGLQQSLSRLGKTAEADEVQAILKQVDADGRRMGEVITGLTRNPDDADLRYEGACIFLRNGVKEDGLRWLEMTLAANPRHLEAHQRLAEHYEQEGMPDSAAVHREIVRKLQAPAP